MAVCVSGAALLPPSVRITRRSKDNSRDGMVRKAWLGLTSARVELVLVFIWGELSGSFFTYYFFLHLVDADV